MRDTSEIIWREALGRLRALDKAWEEPVARQHALLACRKWLAAQTAWPRLACLARLLEPDITRQQFWCVLVPVEREAARCKITDVEILDADLPPEHPSPAPPLPLTVVADSIRSAFNLGGIFRTAECFGVSEVVLCGYTPLPEQPQAARAALGAEKLVPWRQVEDIREALAGLKAAGTRCLALETVAGAPDLAEFTWPFPCALVLGNERFGLDTEVLAACDGLVRIPLYGRKNSLNVVSAFAVAAHEIRRQFERNRGVPNRAPQHSEVNAPVFFSS
ncbi:MAG: RNA methyltransferase [bacterium]